MPNKDTSDNVKNIRDVMLYIKEKKENSYLISVDFEKAFDRLEHDYMLQIFKNKCGFRPHVHRWLKCLYTDIHSCVKCNG